MRRLIVIRPEPGASASVAAARRLGVEAEAVPLFAVVPVEWGPVEPALFEGIVATSANAFRHGGTGLDKLRALPVFAVGEATAAAAREAGFAVAATGDGGREAIPLPDGRLLHLAGRDHLPVGGGAEAVVVYASEPVDPPPALDAVAGAVVAVHSPRAGARLAALVDRRGRTAIAAISAKAAEACGAGWDQVAVASAPREAELLALAGELCHNLPRR